MPSTSAPLASGHLQVETIGAELPIAQLLQHAQAIDAEVQRIAQAGFDGIGQIQAAPVVAGLCVVRPLVFAEFAQRLDVVRPAGDALGEQR